MSKNILNSSGTFDEQMMYAERKRSKKLLNVHVEDDTDKVFWRRVFSSYEDSLEVHFITQHTYRREDQKETTAKGKCNIMKMIDKHQINLSDTEIACVDADYDLLIDDDYSEQLKTNEYIINTHWHSIENIICHPQNLKHLFLDLSAEDDCPIDYQQWLEDKAECYARLFLLFLTSHIYDESEYATTKLADDIKDIEEYNKSVADVLDAHKNYLLSMQYCVDELKIKLEQKDYTQKDYYKIMQGHMLFHQIVYPNMVDQLKKYVEKLKTDEKGLEFIISDYFKYSYSVEHLDIIQLIRHDIETALQLQ